jgi:ribosome maturation protein SDO1
MASNIVPGEKLHINLARLKMGGENFEISVNPDKAIDFKSGRAIDIRDVLMAEKIFSDAHKGLVASEHLLEKIFGTSEPLEVSKTIIQKGEIQLTAEYRDRLRDEKRKRIVFLIQRNGINPENDLPHPATRIELAMEEAKVKIDENKKAEDQVQEIVKKIRAVLPIRFEVREIQIHIPANYAAKSYSLLKNFGTVLKDQWQNDGSLLSIVEIPAGLQQDFFDELNKMTKGEVETKLLKSK